MNNVAGRQRLCGSRVRDACGKAAKPWTRLVKAKQSRPLWGSMISGKPLEPMLPQLSLLRLLLPPLLLPPQLPQPVQLLVQPSSRPSCQRRILPSVDDSLKCSMRSELAAAWTRTTC